MQVVGAESCPSPMACAIEKLDESSTGIFVFSKLSRLHSQVTSAAKLLRSSYCRRFEGNDE